jgi:hypothetical protein
MAGKLVFLNGYASINGVPYSDHISEIHLQLKRDMVDVTSMGANAHQWLPGLQNNTLGLVQFVDSANEGALFSVFSAGTPVAFCVSSVAVGGTTYSGSIIPTTHNPVDGKVGDGLVTPLDFQISGTVTIGTAYT